MSDQNRGKKRPKSYYKKCAAGGKKGKPTNELDSGMKGFLVTCNKYERETVREMYNLLNEYADQMFGPEQVKKPEDERDTDSDDESDDDMEKALAKERTKMVQLAATERRFQNTDTKFKNLIFIRTTLDDPPGFAHKIFTDMVETQTKKARYAQRMIPVTGVCKANMKNIEPTMKTVLQPHFETSFGVGLRYTALCKIRNNNNISRSAILPLINRQIQEMNPLHKLCHDDSQLVVIVEVIRNNCCLSVVKDYFKFKKYNFHEVIKHDDVDDNDASDYAQDEHNVNIEELPNKPLNEEVKPGEDDGHDNEKSDIERQANKETASDTQEEAVVDKPDTSVGQVTAGEDSNEVSASHKKVIDSEGSDEVSASHKKVTDSEGSDEASDSHKKVTDSEGSDEVSASHKKVTDSEGSDEVSASHKKVTDSEGSDKVSDSHKKVMDGEGSNEVCHTQQETGAIKVPIEQDSTEEECCSPQEDVMVTNSECKSDEAQATKAPVTE